MTNADIIEGAKELQRKREERETQKELEMEIKKGNYSIVKKWFDSLNFHIKKIGPPKHISEYIEYRDDSLNVYLNLEDVTFKVRTTTTSGTYELSVASRSFEDASEYLNFENLTEKIGNTLMNLVDL